MSTSQQSGTESFFLTGEPRGSELVVSTRASGWDVLCLRVGLFSPGLGAQESVGSMPTLTRRGGPGQDQKV